MSGWIWLWLAVLVLSVIIEALTEQFVSIWFAPAAIIAAILNFCNIGFVSELVGFAIVTLAGIFILRDLVLKKLSNTDSRTNIDAIIGEKCVVTERIDNFAGCGQAKVKGQIWSARGTGEDDVFEAGEVLTIVAIEGVKLICMKK